jgi:hypothetical protein
VVIYIGLLKQRLVGLEACVAALISLKGRAVVQAVKVVFSLLRFGFTPGRAYVADKLVLGHASVRFLRFSLWTIPIMAPKYLSLFVKDVIISICQHIMKTSVLNSSRSQPLVDSKVNKLENFHWT